MRAALDQARSALATGDVPVGAVVLDPDGVVIGRGRNVREADADPTGHAEVVALRQAAAARGEWRLDGCSLVVTLEPCTMCAGAAVLARVARVVFGAYDEKAGAVGSLWDVVRDRRLNHRPEVVAGVLADESAALLDEFFRAHRDELTVTWRRSVAASTFDLVPAARATATVVAGVRDDQLGDPTPCPACSVARPARPPRRSLGRVHGCGVKDLTPREPSADGSRLEPGFRDRIGTAPTALAEAWRTPRASDGMTMAGPVELPADVAALVALHEVVVHGWDLARATGQPYEPDPASVEAARLRAVFRGAGGRRGRAVRTARRRPRRRPGPRPAGRRHRPPSRLVRLTQRDFGPPAALR